MYVYNMFDEIIKKYTDPEVCRNDLDIDTSKRLDQYINHYTVEEMKEIDTYFFKESSIIEEAEQGNMDFYMVCFGGCASNYIKSVLTSRFTIPRIWEKKLCHYIRPLPIKNVKGCLYIYRHPITALISQWNRNIKKNFYKLRDENEQNLYFTFENMFFLMYHQMKNFKEAELPYQKILIKYETAVKYQDTLNSILGIHVQFRKTESKVHNDFLQKYKIDVHGKYYQKVIQMYESMPEFSVHGAR